MKTHEIVMQWVTEELSSGRLRIGDHLPGERALAETIGVSRGSLREAMRVLEALGTIRSSTGSGPRSGTVITAAPEQALALALNLQLATKQVDPQHVFETRLVLETWAAEQSDPLRGDWANAERLLERMGEPDTPIDEFHALDAEFHVALSRSADNPLISTLMEALRLSIAEHTLGRARSLGDWEPTAVRLRAEHAEILASLRAGDATAASAQLRAHITGYYRETGAGASPP